MVVRKTVTVVFCDLTGSTSLGERTDPEVIWRVLQRYYGEMRAVVERHGGVVEKFIGDAVMAVFGVPTVHEDDAFRAVCAAAEMQARLEDLNEQLEERHGVRIRTRIGVNTGAVVAGDAPSGDALVTGDVVNVAKRLEESAAPGEILLGDLTRRLVADGIDVEERRTLTLKGKSSGVVAWPLGRVVTAGAPPFGRVDAPLVGRAAELQLLRDAYERVTRNRAVELVTVLGPAGIGKSRLAREFGDEADGIARVLTGRCLPYGEGITFWPLAEIVREIGGPDRIEDVVGAVDDAGLLAVELRSALGAGGESSTGGEETFWAIRRFFEALAQDGPLVLCFEDVHWAERTLLDLIDHVHALSRNAPILLLVLARPELLDREPAWAEDRTRAAVLTLEPLSAADSDALLELLAEDRRLDTQTRRRVAERAEGNPLFLEQISAMLAERGDPGERFSVPASIEALISARLDRLADEERTLLERGAIIGRDFPLGALAALCADDLRRTARTRLIDLTRAGLVQPYVSTLVAAEGFRFRHVLIREVAYERVSKELRAELHERYAAWLADRTGTRLTEVEEIVAYHLEQSFRYREQLGPLDRSARELASRAGELLGAAGRRAYERDDMPAAINLLQRAESLLERNQPARFDVLRELSTAFWSVRRFDEAEGLLDALLGEAVACGDRRAEWQARLERAVRRHITDAAATADDLLELTEQAIRVFEEIGDARELARAWRSMSLVPRTLGRYGASIEAIERALVHAHAADDHYEEARLSGYLCTVLFLGPTPAEEAIARCDALSLEAERSRSLQATIATFLAGLQAMRREFDRARSLCASGEAIFVDLGLQLTQVGCTEMAGFVELLAGDPAAAERAFQRGYQMLADGEPTLRAFPAALLAEALLEQGRMDEAAELASFSEANASVHDVETQIRWRRARAKVCALSGDADEAELLASEAVELAESTDALNLRGDALVRFGEVLRMAEREEDAARALRRAVALYDRKGNAASAERAASLLVARVP